MTGRLNMVVALPMEAKPIVQHFDLELLRTSPFKVYTNSKRSTWLIISGVGKVSAGAATAHLASISAADYATTWLNLGVAGHKSLPVGSIVAAHKITDAGSGRAWILNRNLDNQIITKSILTLDKEGHNYTEDEACEMEAAGFYQTVLRFSSRDLIYCIKIISDNERDAEINYREVGNLIQQNISTIDSVVKHLLKLSAERSELACISH